MPRLRKQIDQLRAKTEVDAGDELKMLVDLVARRDALFSPWRTPVRDPICQRFSAIRQRQVDYLSGVRGSAAKATGRDKWKDTHHVRNGLLARGWASATSAGGQVTSLIVTELGDATAQPSISKDHSTVKDALPYLGMIRRFGSLSESTLNQRELTGDPTAWASFSELLLPLLVRGLVTAASDTQGRLFYAAGTGEPVEPPAVAQAVVPWAFDYYFKVYHSERLSLEQISTEGGEVYIPVPAGLAGMKTLKQLEDSKK